MKLNNEPLIYRGMRNRLMETLKKAGVAAEVLNAMAKVPRQLFVPAGLELKAYDNKPLSIGAAQTISQPLTVAKQTELLQLQPFNKVLEIGTGSGYQAAVLAEMQVAVYTIERHKELYLTSKKLLEALKYPIIEQVWGDGYEGLERCAPFDRILITAAIPEIPQKLLTQMVVGGRLVAPVGNDSLQIMTIIDRVSANEYRTSSLDAGFRFVPMLKGAV